MTSSQDMIRGRSNVVTLTNNSGGALVAGDVCVQDTTGDEYATTTTSANSTKQVVIAAESIANGATGKFYVGGYCPLVTPSASVTRGRYLFTHTVAKQAAESATYGAGAFGVILESGTTPSVWLFGATGQAVGGGNVTYESAYASPPGSPAEGDLWLITNSFLSARYNGAAWSYYYGSRSVTKPPASWTWYNQGSATYTDLGHVTLYSPGATTNIRGIYQSVTSDSFSCAAILKPFKPYNALNAGAVGMFLTDGTKSLTFGFTTGTNDIYVNIDQFTNATTYASTPLTVIWRFYALMDYLYLRIRETGGTRYFEMSPDGVNYQAMLSETISGSFMTPTGCGIGLQTESATYFNSVNLLHWNQS